MNFVVIVIDTFSKKALQKFPWLSRLAASEEKGELLSAFGYIPYHTWLSGLEPQESNRAFRFVFDKECGTISPVYERVRHQHKIPEKWKTYFDFSEKRNLDSASYWQSQGSENRTIFEICHQTLQPYKASIWPQNKNIRTSYDWFRQCLKDSVEFIYLEISELDQIAHFQGVDSEEYVQTCQKIDDLIRDIYKDLKATGREYALLVFGDGGIVEINNHINVLPILEHMAVDWGSEALYFIDAVTLRIKILKKAVLPKILDYDWGKKGLELLSEAMLCRIHGNFKDKSIADFFIIPKGNSMFCPNFFSDRKEKSTHGFGPLREGEKTYYVFSSNRESHYSVNLNKSLTSMYFLMKRVIEDRGDGHLMKKSVRHF